MNERGSRIPAGSPAAAGPPAGDLAAEFGRIDVYLFDQILRGRVRADQSILDAGCGGGRNLHYLMKQGADVHGVDTDPDALDRVRTLAAQVAPDLPADNFRNAPVEKLPYPDGAFDVVLSNAVLHFARDEDHFAAMFREMWRVLRPAGVLFVRLASSIGVEELVTRQDGRWHRLPDGSDRFLVDEAYLTHWTEAVGGRLLDPVKTSVVQNLRSMTTWVIGKDV